MLIVWLTIMVLCVIAGTILGIVSSLSESARAVNGKKEFSIAQCFIYSYTIFIGFGLFAGVFILCTYILNL